MCSSNIFCFSARSIATRFKKAWCKTNYCLTFFYSGLFSSGVQMTHSHVIFIFRPLGEEASRNARAVLLPIVDSLSNPPSYLPLGFPEDIGQRLLRLHGNPSVWWVGQFVSFLLRPQQWLEEDVEATVKKSGFENPCVGYFEVLFFSVFSLLCSNCLEVGC